jgi:hypothetical protein
MRFEFLISLVLPIAFVSCGNLKNKTVETAVKDKGLNLDSLLSSSDTTNMIITIDNHINSLLRPDDDLNRLTQPQKNFYYIQELEREVNNGGFSQYFYNSSGDYAHETILALKAIEAENTVKILKSAINEFPDHLVPKDRVKRQEMLSKIEGKAEEIWSNLDSEFYTYPDDLSELNIVYIKKNKKAFER